mmetsp:Transcript_74622/g.201352  ORF Transcript_74622/g.201352 Transcript_74622/m.201352 type:complete len:480 (+) Transcript_74622:18-1457(+)
MASSSDGGSAAATASLGPAVSSSGRASPAAEASPSTAAPSPSPAAPSTAVPSPSPAANSPRAVSGGATAPRMHSAAAGASGSAAASTASAAAAEGGAEVPLSPVSPASASQPSPRGLAPAPFFPGRGGRRFLRPSPASPGSGASARSLGDDPGASARSRRLEQENSDLREAYARKIANTELQCDARMREKDEEMKQWYREQRTNIEKMRAGVIIMHAIFCRLFKKSTDEKSSDKEQFEVRRLGFEEETARTKDEHARALEEKRQQLHDQAAGYERQISDLNAQKAGLEEKVQGMEDLLSQEKLLNASLQEASNVVRAECDELKRKLAENQKVEELARKQAHIDQLEAELRRTKELLERKAKGEAESLRRELMEYVKFIVRILPDDLRQYATDPDTLPQELKDKLNARGSGNPSPPRGAPGPPPWRESGGRVEVLPPVAQLMASAEQFAGNGCGASLRLKQGAPGPLLLPMPQSARGRRY